MCSRHSTRCVYCMWQSAFADIINKKAESYFDIIDWTWYIHVMIDTWLYSWPDVLYYNRLISLFLKLHIVCHCNTWDMLIDDVSYYLLITVLFMLFSYSVHLHDSIIVWSHDICTCTFPFFTHSLGILTPCICTSRYMGISFTEQTFEEIMCIWGVQSLFA